MVPCFSEIIQCEDIEEIQMESKGGTCLRNYKIKFHMTKYLSNLEVCECDQSINQSINQMVFFNVNRRDYYSN
jgi:hypothetical protein